MATEIDQERVVKALGKISREQLIELETCAHCAICADYCPTFIGSKEVSQAPSVRSSMLLKIYDKKKSLISRFLGTKSVTRKDIEALTVSAFNCTMCARCMEACPFHLRTTSLWQTCRNLVRELGVRQKSIERLEEQLKEKRNPYGLDAETRLDWADFTGLEAAPRKVVAKTAFFVGCTTAYKGATQGIAHDLGSIMNVLGEDWTLLGEDEWCCGSPLIMAGDEEGAREYIDHNIETLKRKGISRVLTSCSGCFRALKWEYPDILGGPLPFKVLHSSEYIWEKISAGELKPEPLDERVAYHDPCELARLGGVMDAPRQVIKSFANDYVELPENRLDSRCCGGGGLLQSVNNPLRMAVVKRRLEQVKESGAKILTSGCPACKLAFVDGVREEGLDFEVMDIVELVASQINKK